MVVCCLCLEDTNSLILSNIKCKNCHWDCCQKCMDKYLNHNYTKCFMCDFQISTKKNDFLDKNTFDCWFQQGRVPHQSFCPCSYCLEDEW